MNSYQISQLQHIHKTAKELREDEENDFIDAEEFAPVSGGPKVFWEAVPAFSSISKDGQGTAKCKGCNQIFPEAQLTYGSKSILITPQHYCPTCSKALGIIEFEEMQD